MGPRSSNGTADGSVNGRNGRLEARGSEHANAKRGKEQSVFRCLAKGRARGNIYTTSTPHGRQRSKTKQDKKRTEVALILLYTARGRGQVRRRVVPKKASRATCVTWGDTYRGACICGIAQRRWASTTRRHRGLRRNKRGTWRANMAEGERENLTRRVGEGAEAVTWPKKVHSEVRSHSHKHALQKFMLLLLRCLTEITSPPNTKIYLHR